MDLKLEELIALAMKFPPESRKRLAQLLTESVEVNQVRDSGTPHAESYPVSRDLLLKESIGMTSVTVVLPDDLANQAKAAGLLAEKRLEELIRRALREQQSVGKPASAGATHRRRLVRRNGRLVAEALPGEQPITDAEIRDLLNKMEW